MSQNYSAGPVSVVDSDPAASRTAVSVHRLDAATRLAEPLRDALTVDGACLLDADVGVDPGAIEALRVSLGSVRDAVMETLAGTEFQGVMHRVCRDLAARHFDGPTLFQRAPSIRLHLPDALGTSWHVDNWYGHVPQSRTFWCPLTDVPPGAGVSFAREPELLERLERELGNDLELADINRLCAEVAEEIRCDPGEYLMFDARTLHGSVGNASGRFRCSLDFRGVAERFGVGNKPLANYRRIDKPTPNAANEATVLPVPVAGASRTAVKYISGANGSSAKYQHVLIEAYAKHNDLQVVRNEAEIESVPARPVLLAYAQRRVPDAGNYDHLLLGSLDQLPNGVDATRALLQHCLANGVALHFVAEDRQFPASMGIEECIERFLSRAGGALLTTGSRAA